MNGSVEIPHLTAGRGGVIVVGSVTIDVTAFSTRLPSAVLVAADGSTTFEAVRVEAIDTSAAGAACAGYLGAALAACDCLEASIIRATAAGALAVTHRGVSPSLPFTAEVDALVNRPTATAHLDSGPPAATQ